MANKKTTAKKKNSRSTKTTRTSKKQLEQELYKKKIVQNEVIGVVILFFGIFMLYSLLSKDSGVFGNNLHNISMFLFGNIGTSLIGAAFLILGFYVISRLKPFKELITLICVTVIIFNIMAAFNIGGELLKYGAFSNQLFVSVLNVVTKGGIIGIWLGGIYTTLLSEIGGYIFIATSIIVCLILIFKDNIALYKEDRKALRLKEKEVKMEIREERLNEKLLKREEEIRKQALEVKSKPGFFPAFRSKLPKNPYDAKSITTDKDKEEVLDKWEKEYKESKNPFKKKAEKREEPIIKTYYRGEQGSFIDFDEEEKKSNKKENIVTEEKPNKEEIKNRVRKEQGLDDIIKETEESQNKANKEIERTKNFVSPKTINDEDFIDDKPIEHIEKIDLSDIDRANKEQAEQLNNIKAAMEGKNTTSDTSLVEEKEKIPYVFPKVSLLKRADRRNNKGERDRVLENTKVLEETLANFKIGARVTEVSIGPTVTRYELELEPGIKVSRVVGLQDNLAMALAANGIRMEAPIPGKSAIGIEVPNKEVSVVGFREIVEDKKFKDSKSKLSIALGKNVTGDMVVMDIAKLPHLLIAGATGSGKSVCINAIISSILFHASPEEVRLILIDPKMVELNVYEGIPHLLVPVETDPNHAAGALKWAEKQMKIRYDLFAQNRVRDIKGYNKKMEETGGEKMAQWVIIIDELADLMMTCASQVESAICRLAQLARAAGIHLVLATQRPSVDVITGLIKANIPSRISFAVSSQIDSRTILDMAGAEKLLGRGDMLYAPVGSNAPMRAQCAYISDEEVEEVVKFIKKTQVPNYDEDAIKGIDTVAVEENMPGSEKDVNREDFIDDKFNDALNIAFELGEISTSMLQRRLRIGYARAGRIVDELEQKGIVSAPEGSKPRKVLKKREDFFSNSVVESDEVYPEGTLDIEEEIY